MITIDEVKGAGERSPTLDELNAAFPPMGPAEALLYSLGNPEGWSADGSTLSVRRVLFVDSGSWRVPSFSYSHITSFRLPPSFTAGECASMMALAIQVADGRLVQQASRDNPDFTQHELKNLMQMCRFAPDDEVA